MKARARLLGHGIHPMLIVFPLGLLGASVAFDIVHLATRDAEWANISYWMIIAGLIGGALAAVFGWIDWSAIPQHTRAATIGLVHGVVNAIALVLFLVSWYLRMRAREGGFDPSIWPFIVSVVGLVTALVGGWLGGELVERLGVSVYPDANVNAPSSLTNDERRTAT